MKPSILNWVAAKELKLVSLMLGNLEVPQQQPGNLSLLCS